MVEREGRRLLIGGDTAITDAFRQHRAKGPFEAAVMPIGAYDPWIWNHCSPEQAVAMADAAGVNREQGDEERDNPAPVDRRAQRRLHLELVPDRSHFGRVGEVEILDQGVAGARY